MLSIPEELKELYKQENVFKYITLYFPELDLAITNEKIVDKSFTLTESLCSETDLTFGACEAAMIEITVADIIQELSGKVMVITQTVEEYEMPLGTYIVDTAEKQSDKRYKKLTAYDYMIKTDVDIAAWYNGLTWPQTVKSMRESLLTYLGLSYESQTLTNDTVSLSKTINPASLIGRDILRLLCSINGGFGHFTRYNTFKVIQLSGLGLYPSETLYPSEDLFPSESGEIITPGSYRTINYSEYIVEPITMVKIQSDDEDTGVTAGTGDNPYIMAGNYLLFGKTGTELQIIADNIFLQVKNKYYRQHTTVMNGLPYMEVGDAELIITTNDAIESFIFKRIMTGVHTLVDTISATGNQYRSQTVTPNTEIQQLKNKTLRIQKSVDGLEVELADTAEGLEAMISFTAGELQTQITDNYNDLNSSITQTAGQLQTQITDNKNDANSQFTQQANLINLKVAKGTVSSEISLESGQVTISGNRLVVNSTNFQLDGSGNATFSGNVTGATITGGILSSTNGTYTTTIQNGQINTTFVNASGSGNTVILSPNGLNVSGGATVLIDGQAPSMPGHTQLSTSVTAVLTGGGADNISFGGRNAAAVAWVTANFQPLSPSDFRLKKNFRPLSELPIALFMELKPYLYEFKCTGLGFGHGIHMGFLAQQIESAFERYGLNPLDYNLIEIREPRSYTDEGQYLLDGKVHVVNYNNLIAWTIEVIQQQETRMITIEERLKALEEGVKNG